MLIIYHYPFIIFSQYCVLSI